MMTPIIHPSIVTLSINDLTYPVIYTGWLSASWKEIHQSVVDKKHILGLKLRCALEEKNGQKNSKQNQEIKEASLF